MFPTFCWVVAGAGSWIRHHFLQFCSAGRQFIPWRMQCSALMITHAEHSGQFWGSVWTPRRNVDFSFCLEAHPNVHISFFFGSVLGFYLTHTEFRKFNSANAKKVNLKSGVELRTCSAMTEERGKKSSAHVCVRLWGVCIPPGAILAAQNWSSLLSRWLGCCRSGQHLCLPHGLCALSMAQPPPEVSAPQRFIPCRSQAAKENFQTIRRGLVATQGNFLTLSIILRKNKQCEIAQDCLEPKTKCSSAGKAG